MHGTSLVQESGTDLYKSSYSQYGGQAPSTYIFVKTVLPYCYYGPISNWVQRERKREGERVIILCVTLLLRHCYCFVTVRFLCVTEWLWCIVLKVQILWFLLLDPEKQVIIGLRDPSLSSTIYKKLWRIVRKIQPKISFSHHNFRNT